MDDADERELRIETLNFQPGSGQSFDSAMIFFVPKEGGGYRPVKGRMVFQEGRLVKVSVKGQDWRTPGTDPQGPVVLYQAMYLHWDGPALKGHVLRSTFVDGRLVTMESLGEAELENDQSEMCG